MRQCETCSKELVRKRWSCGRSKTMIEPLPRFEKRRFCGNECRRKGYIKLSPVRLSNSLEVAPVLSSEVECSNRCWAGFKAGQRCVKERDGHARHCDSAGNEWTGILPYPVVCFERVRDDPYYEIVSLRHAQR